MELILIAVVVLLVIAGLAMGLANKGKGSIPVEAKPFLTKRESAALVSLEEVLPRHRIHAQVAMGALLKPKKGLSAKDRGTVRNKFAQKIVDFVAEDRDNGELILIEIDDRTHDATKDQLRDAMTAAAGYRTVRVPASTKPTPDALRALFEGDDTAGEYSAVAHASVERVRTFGRSKPLSA